MGFIDKKIKEAIAPAMQETLEPLFNDVQKRADANKVEFDRIAKGLDDKWEGLNKRIQELEMRCGIY